MENYINGKSHAYENFKHDGKDVHAVSRIREGEERLTLLVLDISNGEKDVPVPSSERLDVSRSIRRRMLEIRRDTKESKAVREIFKGLLQEYIYYINDETDAGNPGVYALG